MDKGGKGLSGLNPKRLPEMIRSKVDLKQKSLSCTLKLFALHIHQFPSVL
jgi:hypothetical protein